MPVNFFHNILLKVYTCICNILVAEGLFFSCANNRLHTYIHLSVISHGQRISPGSLYAQNVEVFHLQVFCGIAHNFDCPKWTLLFNRIYFNCAWCIWPSTHFFWNLWKWCNHFLIFLFPLEMTDVSLFFACYAPCEVELFSFLQKFARSTITRTYW